jgi:hypothetical protein
MGSSDPQIAAQRLNSTKRKGDKMKYLKLISTSIFCIYSAVALSKPVYRDVTITSFHPMSVDRTHCPTCSGFTRVYVNKSNWGDTNCRNDAADLHKDDEHILSLLLSAWIAGKSVKIEVNDQSIPIGGVCKITAAWISN